MSARIHRGTTPAPHLAWEAMPIVGVSPRPRRSRARLGQLVHFIAGVAVGVASAWPF